MMPKPRVWKGGPFDCWHASNVTGCFRSLGAALEASASELRRTLREVPC